MTNAKVNFFSASSRLINILFRLRFGFGAQRSDSSGAIFPGAQLVVCVPRRAHFNPGYDTGDACAPHRAKRLSPTSPTRCQPPPPHPSSSRSFPSSLSGTLSVLMLTKFPR